MLLTLRKFKIFNKEEIKNLYKKLEDVSETEREKIWKIIIKKKKPYLIREVKN